MLQCSIRGAAHRRRSFNAASMALLTGDRAATQQRWCFNAASIALLAGGRAATQQCWCFNAASMELLAGDESFKAASMVLGWRCSRASTERRCSVGARPELQRSFIGVIGALSGLQWSSAGVAMEFAGGSLLCWSSVGLQWSSPEAVSAALELSAGLQWRCVEALALAPAYCHPTTPSMLIRRLKKALFGYPPDP